jgi:hypothetical protein
MRRRQHDPEKVATGSFEWIMLETVWANGVRRGCVIRLPSLRQAISFGCRRKRQSTGVPAALLGGFCTPVTLGEIGGRDPKHLALGILGIQP